MTGVAAGGEAVADVGDTAGAASLIVLSAGSSNWHFNFLSITLLGSAVFQISSSGSEAFSTDSAYQTSSLGVDTYVLCTA